MQGLQGTKIALLIDFDNVILGVEDPGFDVELVVNALRSRGVVVMGRAYGDWYRHHRHRRKLMEQGIELVETPVFGPLIKNSADIRIVIDGLDIATAHTHIDTFCLVSGDSDFLPLIKRLQLLGKNVIVIAGNKFTSDLVRRNCNEYLAYENLLAESVGATEDASTLEGSFHLLARAIDTLTERGMDIRSSTVKQMMLQLNPAFSERTFGCYQFKQFLDKAARANVVQLTERDGSAGEHDVLLPEKTGQIANKEASARPSSTQSNATETAPREMNGRAEKRAASPRAPRERNRTQTPSGKLQTTAPASLQDATPTASEVQPNVATETPDTVPVAPISASSLASRPGLRRGRLRFSAKGGASTVTSHETSEPNANEVVAQKAPDTSVEAEEVALEAGSSTRLTEAAPVDQALDAVQTPQEVLPDEATLAQAVADTETEAGTISEVEDAEAVPTKRRGTRGGRRRRGAKTDGTTDEAAVNVAENEVVAPVTESAPVEAPPVEPAMNEVASVAVKSVESGSAGSVTLETETSEAAPVEPKKRASRGRRSAKKATSTN
ncbi:MAG TPA: NYN domain-containing protein, partial [Abditibacteriaceae bacterium]|nr:NYN domain-containing protein [Abditibacteriaceae bacterium]